ncbi:MAG: hypothetical protein WBC91_17140 [Phototrophicaceae bacterium]
MYDKVKKREMGRSLRGFLILLIIIAILVIIFLSFTLAQISQTPSLLDAERTQLTWLIISTISLQTFVIIFSIGMWLWRAWGYYGLVLLFLLIIVQGIFLGEGQQVITNIVWLSVLYFLARKKMHLLDWKL